MSKHIRVHSNYEAELSYYLLRRELGIWGGYFPDDYFYIIWQGEFWPERSAGLGREILWNWFFIRGNFEGVYWYSIYEDIVLTLEEWRESEHYLHWLREDLEMGMYDTQIIIESPFADTNIQTMNMQYLFEELFSN